MTRALAAALLLVALAPARAADRDPPRHRQTVDLAGGAGRGLYSGAVAWNHLYEWLPRVSAGLGARLSTFTGAGHHRYTTAPKGLRDAGRIRELRVHEPLVTSLNLQLVATIRLLPRVEAGLDLDLAGVSFGPGRRALSGSPDPRFGGVQEVEPSRLNAFLWAARDRGSLDSEFFLAWWATDRVVVRAGVSHHVTEYRTDRALDDGNRRFRLSRSLGFLAVGWRLN